MDEAISVLPMAHVSEAIERTDFFRNIAAKAWPNGVVIGYCPKCLKERQYTWDDAVRMMQKGLPRCKCSGLRIDLK